MYEQQATFAKSRQYSLMTTSAHLAQTASGQMSFTVGFTVIKTIKLTFSCGLSPVEQAQITIAPIHHQSIALSPEQTYDATLNDIELRILVVGT